MKTSSAHLLNKTEMTGRHSSSGTRGTPAENIDFSFPRQKFPYNLCKWNRLKRSVAHEKLNQECVRFSQILHSKKMYTSLGLLCRTEIQFYSTLHSDLLFELDIIQLELITMPQHWQDHMYPIDMTNSDCLVDDLVRITYNCTKHFRFRRYPVRLHSSCLFPT